MISLLYYSFLVLLLIFVAREILIMYPVAFSYDTDSVLDVILANLNVLCTGVDR